MPEWRCVNGTKTARPTPGGVVTFRRGKDSEVLKWSLIGSGIAAGAGLIPLIPAVKRRAMRVTTILTKDHRMVSGMIRTLEMTPRFNGMVRKTLFDQIRNNFMVH